MNILQQLKSYQLTSDTIKKHNVKIDSRGIKLQFSTFDGKFIDVFKWRVLNENKYFAEQKELYFYYCFHELYKSDNKYFLLVEGEFKALYTAQETGLPCIGFSGINCIDMKLVNELIQFIPKNKKLILCVDKDYYTNNKIKIATKEIIKRMKFYFDINLFVSKWEKGIDDTLREITENKRNWLLNEINKQINQQHEILNIKNENEIVDLKEDICIDNNFILQKEIVLNPFIERPEKDHGNKWSANKALKFGRFRQLYLKTSHGKELIKKHQEDFNAVNKELKIIWLSTLSKCRQYNSIERILGEPDEHKPEYQYNLLFCCDYIKEKMENYEYNETKIEPILNLIYYLLNNNQENITFFLQWLRNLFSFKQNRYVPILFETKGGAGKTTFMQLLHFIIGSNNCSLLNSNILRSRFTGYAINKRLIIFDDPNQYANFESIKSIIGSKLNTFEEKYGVPGSEINLTNFIITSNVSLNKIFNTHGKVDRRYIILQCKSIEQEKRFQLAQQGDQYQIDVLDMFDQIYDIIDRAQKCFSSFGKSEYPQELIYFVDYIRNLDAQNINLLQNEMTEKQDRLISDAIFETSDELLTEEEKELILFHSDYQQDVSKIKDIIITFFRDCDEWDLDFIPVYLMHNIIKSVLNDRVYRKIKIYPFYQGFFTHKQKLTCGKMGESNKVCFVLSESFMQKISEYNGKKFHKQDLLVKYSEFSKYRKSVVEMNNIANEWVKSHYNLDLMFSI